MARPRTFTRGRPHGGSRRRTGWFKGPSEVTPTSITGIGSLLWDTGLQAIDNGLTVARIRGEITLSLTTVTTVLDGFREVAAGICVVSENAFDAGTASVPSPLTDVAWDGWMWHELYSQFRGFSTTPTGQSPLEAIRMPIDTKAMRKLKATDVLIGVVETGVEVGTASLLFGASTRALLFLP